MSQTSDFVWAPLSLGLFIASYVLWRRLPDAVSPSTRHLQKAMFNLYLVVFLICYGFGIVVLIAFATFGFLLRDTGSGFVAMFVGVAVLAISALMFFILFLVRIIQFFVLRNSTKTPRTEV